MKIDKQLILPVALILTFSIYLGIKSAGKMNYNIPDFIPIEEEQIDTIEIDKSSGALKLYSDNGIWKFDPDNLRAEPFKIDEMLSFLANPQFIDMVSDSENYQNYGLNEGQYISVKAKINGNNTEISDRELLIGDINTSSKFAFIRKMDNKAVFTVRANIRKLFDISESDLLNKKILDIDTTKIDKIVLTFDNKQTTINKSVDSNDKDSWKTDTGLDPDTEATSQSLRYLLNSRFDSYIPEGEGSIEGNIFTINLYEGDIVHSLTITRENEKNYFGRSNFAGKDFILSKNTGTQIIEMFKNIITVK